MARYIARDVRNARGTTQIELLLDLGAAGRTVSATFTGSTGARLFGVLADALARKGKDEVLFEDGSYLVGGVADLDAEARS